MANNNILLIQPRHIYAPSFEKKKLGHIYMPTSLLAAAAILLEMGIDVTIVDENIEKANINSNLIGINLLGAPYIPVALKYINRIKDVFKNNYTILLGGQIISGFKKNELSKIFSKNVLNGNTTETLASVFNIDITKIPKIKNLSFVKAFDLFDDYIFKLYLYREFSFYLSQGCKYSCSFCSAHRSHIYKNTNKTIRRKEVYRDIGIALFDLEYLINKAILFNISSLNFYLSNLDLFQTPLLLHKFALGIIKLKEKYPSFNITFRGLSTSRSFLNTHKTTPFIIYDLVKAGLTRVGFGIDGATPKVYKATKKPQTVQESIDVIRISKDIYDITPEILMVFGHNNAEDEKSLKLAYSFCKKMLTQYGAFPRPHVAKDIVPGNDGWINEDNKNIKEFLINNPILFQNLDYTAFPSSITHPDHIFRELVSYYYNKVCELPNSLTQPIKPYFKTMTKFEYEQINNYNIEKYDI